MSSLLCCIHYVLYTHSVHCRATVCIVHEHVQVCIVLRAILHLCHVAEGWSMQGNSVVPSALLRHHWQASYYIGQIPGAGVH